MTRRTRHRLARRSVSMAAVLMLGFGIGWASAHVLSPSIQQSASPLTQAQTGVQTEVMAALASLDTAGTSFGPTDADVTIYEFSDYNCGFCKRAFGEVLAAMESDGKTRLVVVEYPILAQSSADAARLALHAAQKSQTSFTQIHTALMRHRGAITPQLLNTLASQHGIKDFLAPNAVITQQLQTNHQIGEALSIRGTPSFVIGGQVIGGAINREAFLQLIRAARAQSG